MKEVKVGGMEAETDRGEKPGTCASTLTTPTPEEQDQLCNVENESVPQSGNRNRQFRAPLPYRTVSRT